MRALSWGEEGGAGTLSLLEEESDAPRFDVCAMSVACVCGFRPGGIQGWEGRCWTATTTTVAGGVPVMMSVMITAG